MAGSPSLHCQVSCSRTARVVGSEILEQPEYKWSRVIWSCSEGFESQESFKQAPMILQASRSLHLIGQPNSGLNLTR